MLVVSSYLELAELNQLAQPDHPYWMSEIQVSSAECAAAAKSATD